MPTFVQKRPPSIAASFASLLSGSPELSPEDSIAVQEKAAVTNQHNALAQRAMAEVQAMREADIARRDPAKAVEYGAFASGVPVPQAQQFYNAAKGMVAPNPYQNDDQGNAMPPAAYVKPDLPPAQERTLSTSIASVLGNLLATGKTNADQMAKAGGELDAQQLRGLISATRDPVEQNRLHAALPGAGYHEPYSGGITAGRTVNQETGQTAEVPGLAPLYDQNLRAQGSQREAAATLAEARATAAEGRVARGGGGQPKAPSGYRWTADATGNAVLEPIPGGPAAGGISGGSASDPGAPRGADFLKTLPPSAADQVKALAEGRMAFPAGAALRAPYWQQMLAAVGQYDPSFDAVNYNSRAATRKDFTSGKSAVSINAMNTAIGHLETLSSAADDLHNSSVPVWNKLANFVESNTGDPRVKRFNTAREAIANEVTRVYRGAGGAEADIKAWKEQLDTAGSPQQLHGVIKQVAGLLESKISAMGAQYAQGLGTTKEPIQLVTPDARSVLQRLEQKAGGKRSQSAPSEDRKVVNGKTYMKVNGQWFEDQRQ